MVNSVYVPCVFLLCVPFECRIIQFFYFLSLFRSFSHNHSLVRSLAHWLSFYIIFDQCNGDKFSILFSFLFWIVLRFVSLHMKKKIIIEKSRHKFGGSWALHLHLYAHLWLCVYMNLKSQIIECIHSVNIELVFLSLSLFISHFMFLFVHCLYHLKCSECWFYRSIFIATFWAQLDGICSFKLHCVWLWPACTHHSTPIHTARTLKIAFM